MDENIDVLCGNRVSAPVYILRFRQPVHFVQHETEVVQRRQIVGRDPQGAPVAVDGLLQISARLVGVAQILRDLVVARILTQRQFQFRDRQPGPIGAQTLGLTGSIRER